MYNKHGRGMRLLHLIVPIAFLPFALTLPESMVTTVLACTALIVIEMIAVWGTLPDMRSAWQQIKRAYAREFGGYW